MGRKILFITTDQQRFDALGCNGGLIARTPNIDALAATGINYNRAHPQNVVCMPSRSTMITGQHVATHGVWMNGVPLPNDAPSVATTLHDAGYKTALIGKAHFEPFLDPFLRFVENQLANTGAHSLIEDGHLHRGFDHMESASHGGMGSFHYAQWLMKNHPEAVPMYYRVLDMSLQVSAEGGGDTGAPQAHINNIPREWYHTDWVADRAIAWLDSLDADADWFCWVSFPDPHHPWDPPASETHRVNWRDIDLPAGYPQNRAQREAILDNKPAQWRKWYDGEFVSNYEAWGTIDLQVSNDHTTLPSTLTTNFSSLGASSSDSSSSLPTSSEVSSASSCGSADSISSDSDSDCSSSGCASAPVSTPS